MATSKNKGPIVDPALCRCCRNIKKCRVLNVEYEFCGAKEIYSEMFMDCFGLLLSNLDAEAKELGICATCVVRLRDAAAFKTQVLQCEQAFLNAKLENKVEVEIKAEPCGSDADSTAGDKGEIGGEVGGEIGDDNGGEIGDENEDDYKGDDEGDDCKDPDYVIPSKEPQKKPPRLKQSSRTAVKKDSTVSTKGKKTRGRKRGVKLKIKQLQNKMDSLLQDENLDEKTEQAPPKKPKLQKLEKTEPDQQNMIFSNAVLMVHNSFICPFLNRISNYYCYYCKDQFTNPVELREHTLNHDPKDFESMMEYKKMPKMDITRIDCRLCNEKINEINSLRLHLKETHNLKIYDAKNEFLTFKLSLDKVECTECGQNFPYFDALKKHVIEHFGTFICDQCGACFLEQNSLRTHIKSHSKVESLFPCEICGKSLKSKYSKYLHIATIHEKKPTVNCYKCEAMFLSYAQRNRHLIEVHGDKRTFACKQCDKVYNRRKTLMEHMRRYHLKVYRHQCELCEQRFYLPSRLKEHMATHTGDRSYRCEFCDKSYPRLQSLQEHARCHSERRYKKTQDFMDAAY